MKTLKSLKAGKKFHVVLYVENCDSKVKKFYCKKKLKSFVDSYSAEYPDSEAMNTGSWIDTIITDIAGKVTFVADCY